jgi:hypothetical protein
METKENGVDLDYRPHPHQLKIHDLLRKFRFVVLVTHRRFGKTLLAVMALIHSAMMCEKPNPRYAYVAPRLKQAKAVAWMYLCDKVMKIPGARKHEGELYVELPNGARITLFGATDGNEETIRGNYFDGLALDEVAGIKPHVWPEIIRPALADRMGWAVFLGTPHGVDVFYELYQEAMKDSAWSAAMYRVDETDLPWLPEEEIELARRTMSENAFRQEFLCDFSAASESAFITIDLVSSACQREYEYSDYGFAPRVIGVDVARFGDDKSVIQCRQGLYAEEPLIFPDIDNMSLAGKVAEEYRSFRADACFVDAGRGEGVIDRLRQLGYPVFEVNFGGKPLDEHFADKRTEMWSEMRVWLEQGGRIPNHPELKTDLCVPSYEFKPSGKVKLESKESIKGRGMPSPDLGDALALTFAQPVMSTEEFDDLPEYAEA